MDIRRRLYHARINRHLSLEQVGTRTALSPSILRNIDEGRFELLPSGVYARSYVRTFAVEVGLDPEATLAQLEHLLPGAPDPLPALNEIKASRFRGYTLGGIEDLSSILNWMKETVKRSLPATRSLRDRVDAWPKAVLNPVARWPVLNRVVPGPVLNRVAPWAVLNRVVPGPLLNRVAPWAVLNRVGPWPLLNRVAPWAVLNRVAPWPLLNRVAPWAVLNRVAPWVVLNRVGPWPWLNRYSAAAIDAIVLLAVDALLVLLISLSSGVGIEALLQSSGRALGAFCAIPIALYFVLFEGIAGTTAGRRVCSLIDPSPDHPLTLPDILRRAVFH